jgi:hypothetical protein
MAPGSEVARVKLLERSKGYPTRRRQAEGDMAMYVSLQPLVALIAGILILIMPRLLNYIVAIYLIVIGLLGLLRQ